MGNGITKKYMMSVINKLPMSFIYQFFKLSCYYSGFVNMKDKVKQQKMRSWYISVCANVHTMINTLLSLSTNGQPVETQIKLMQDKIEQTLKEANDFYVANMPEVEPELDALIIHDGGDSEIEAAEESKPKKATKKSTTKKSTASKTTKSKTVKK